MLAEPMSSTRAVPCCVLMLVFAASCAASTRPRDRRSHAAKCPSMPPAASQQFAFPFDPAGCACTSTDRGPAYEDLECACESGHCPRSFDDGLELVRRACATDKDARALRADGCGKTVLSTGSGSCGIELHYDATSGTLIGGSSRCVVARRSRPSCEDAMQSAFAVGATAECDTWKTCSLCGGDGVTPACDARQRCAL
jgi:hypothetical protein